MSHRRDYCTICDVKLTPEEKSGASAYDFIITCNKHKQYSGVVNPEMVQLELGIIKELPKRFDNCEICDTELSKEERATLEKTDFIITCNKHREVRKNFQIDLAKLWFDFKKDNPEYTQDKHWNKFAEWRMKHVK